MKWIPALEVVNRRWRRHAGQQAYRGALIRPGFWRYEMRLLALLWTGIAALGYLAGQQTYRMHENDESEKQFSRPPQRLSAPAETMQLENALALAPVAETGEIESLFYRKRKESMPLAQGNPQIKTHIITHPHEPSGVGQLSWQLNIQRSQVTQANVESQLTMAQSQFQAGNFELAQHSFEQILLQDPHQVVALAGMLVVISQRGEEQQRENYLKRLRQEIPGYQPDDDLFLLQVKD